MAKKIAHRDLKRGPSGVMHTIFIDAETGKEIPASELKNYEIVDQSPESHLEQIKSGNVGAGPLGGTPTTKPPGQSDEPEGEDEEIDEPFWKKNERASGELTIGKAVPRTAENNYGYIDKPTLVGLAGMLPGMIGMGTKAINAAINANNVAAVNAARKEWGMEPLDAKDTLKGVLKDNKGVVGHVKIGNEVVEISLDKDQREDGITQMTPQEAQAKAQELGVEIAPATEAEVEAKAKEVGAENKSIIGQILGWNGNLLDKVFGKSPLKSIKSPFAPKVAEAKPKTEALQTEALTPATDVVDNSPVTRAPIGAPANIDYSTLGPNRNEPVTGPLPGVVGQAIGSVLGPGYTAKVTSGTYDEHKQEAIDNAVKEANAMGLTGKAFRDHVAAAGRYGSVRHDDHKAMDFGIFGPDNKQVTDPQALNAVAGKLAELGVTGIGLGKGYMGGANIHADFAAEEAPAAWGAGGTGANMDPSLRASLLGTMKDASPLPDAFSPDGIPTPTPKPADAPVAQAPDVMSSIEQAKAIGAEIAKGIAAAIGPNQAVASEAPKAPQTAEAPKTGGFGGLVNSANQALEQLDKGPKTRAPADYDKLAYTIAGELGSKTLTGIAAGNPEAIANARQEVAAIMSTVDNRTKSTRFASVSNPLDSILDPSQYNSLMPENRTTTLQNYNTYGEFVKQAIQDYDQGVLPSPAPNATHYFNPEISNPDWAQHAKSGVRIGEHFFADVALPGTNQSEFQRALPDTMRAPSARPERPGIDNPGRGTSPGGFQGGPIGPGRGTSPGSPGPGAAIGPGRGLSPGNPGPGAAVGPGRGFSPGGPTTPSERAEASTGSRGKGSSGANSVKTTSHGPTAGLAGKGAGGFIGGPRDPGVIGQAIAGDFAGSVGLLGANPFGGASAGSLPGSAKSAMTSSSLTGPPGKFSGMGSTIEVESVNTGTRSKGFIPGTLKTDSFSHSFTSGYSGNSKGSLSSGLGNFSSPTSSSTLGSSLRSADAGYSTSGRSSGGGGLFGGLFGGGSSSSSGKSSSSGSSKSSSSSSSGSRGGLGRSPRADSAGY